MARPLAAVTGATGFLGSHVVRALSERGFDTRVLVRQAAQHPVWRDLNPESVLGDVRDPTAIRDLIAGADVVVHAAALTAARSRREFFSVNVEGTQRIAQAISSSGTARLLLVSSLAAREPELSSYAESKCAAERLAEQALPDYNRLTVVRPPAIYGPWDRATLTFFKAAVRRFAPKLPNRDGRVALIHVEDAASAIAQLATRNGRGGRYSLADGNPSGYSWTEILNAMATATGTHPYYIETPEWLLKATASVTPLVYWLLRQPNMLTRGKVRELLHEDWSVDVNELPPSSLWRPAYDLDRGFQSTVAWFRSVGWLQQ